MPFSTDQFFAIFIIFYATHLAVESVLDLLNLKNISSQSKIPAFYQNTISQETFAKSRVYNRDKLIFGLVSRLFGIPVFWVLILCDGLSIIEVATTNIVPAPTLTHAVVYCLLIALIFAILELPFKAYMTFVIEERHGFNKTNWTTFFADSLKGLLLGGVLLTPVLYAVFAFLNMSGSLWWIWAWATVAGFQFVTAAIYPAFIAPLFNRFTPLEDGELKTRITDLAKQIQFKMSGIMVSDGSKRSGHSNAYFAGLGRFRRIVLFDTLIAQLTTDELVAVLAHEMGHNVKKHMRNGVIVSSLVSLCGFFFLAKLMEWPGFYEAFNAPQNPQAALVLFALTSSAITFPLIPLFNAWSRHNEFEADAFAAAITRDPNSMTSSLLKLTKENLSNLVPHAWYRTYHYSHPTTEERAQAIASLPF